jgi:hypothetical protein
LNRFSAGTAPYGTVRSSKFTILLSYLQIV